MKSRDYCCCAIPLVNAGIYAVLIEQFTLGMLIGGLSVGTTSIVGAVTPSFAPWLLGIIGFIGAAVQFFGFLGVSREKPIMYRRYITLHSLVTTAGFSIALVWIILSASRHSTAVTNCETQFFKTNESQGEVMCEIFPWVDVGIMGGLWVILAIAQTYFYFMLLSYGSGQRRDHEKYNAVYDAVPANPSNFKATRAIPKSGYSHVRQNSGMSASDILADEFQQPRSTLDNNYSTYPPPPLQAYTMEPSTTPLYNDAYSHGEGKAFATALPHPAEGSFGRKTPRRGPSTSQQPYQYDGRYYR